MAQTADRSAPQTPSRPYRPDIDGLRAIAILAVVLFHIDRSWVPGGFAGVDIFFVISGYLITGHIASDHAAGRFSYLEFYRRRVKRIIPVLLLVILVTGIVGAQLLLPRDLVQLAYSSIASIFFVVNIYFTYGLDFNYFSNAGETAPLLHVWSLGVEEQFYIFWPLLAVALLKLRRPMLIFCVLMLGVLAMYAISELLVRESPIFAYYMLPARAGELGLGALLALLPMRRLKLAVSAIVAVTGLALLAYGLIYINAGKTFPGINSVPSTLGTALVIFAGTRADNVVSRLLAARPLVWIGLISYSLYLWHWPVVAFIRYVDGGLSLPRGLFALVVMVVLSVISYWFVERPCRATRRSFTYVASWQFLAPATVLGSLCLAVIWNGGTVLPVQASRAMVPVGSQREPAEPAYMYSYGCQYNGVPPDGMDNTKCIINGAANGFKEPKVLLWGDSNAAHYVGVMGAVAYKTGFAFRNIAHSACPPLLDKGPAYARPAYKDFCDHSLSIVLPALARYDTLIIAADWTDYTGLHPDFLDIQFATFGRLLKEGKTIIILGRVPILQSVDQECETKAQNLSWIDCKSRSTVKNFSNYEVNEKLNEFASSNERAYYFDVFDVICPQSNCSAYLENKLVYYDNAHFSMDGSWIVGRALVKGGKLPDFFVTLGRPAH